MQNPGFPKDLAEIIAIHRDLFGGYTMTATAAEGGTPAATEGTPPAATAEGTPAVTPPASSAEDVASLPEWAQKAISDARQDATKARTTAKAAAAEEARNEVIQQIGKAMGLVKDDSTKLDPVALQAALAQQQADGSLTKVQLEAMKIAIKPETGVNALALLDSNSFLAAVKGLAPTDTAGIAAAIKAAVEANPMLKAAPGGPPKSGAEFSGGTGEKPKNNIGLKGALDAFYAPKS